MNDYQIIKSARFTIPADPQGYYAEGSRRPNYKRASAYRQWKIEVALYANLADIELPLEADEDHPIFISTIAYFQNRRHCDPENVRKGISDALFYKPKGCRTGTADKYTGGTFDFPRYDPENPRVEVIISWYERIKK